MYHSPSEDYPDGQIQINPGQAEELYGSEQEFTIGSIAANEYSHALDTAEYPMTLDEVIATRKRKEDFDWDNYTSGSVDHDTKDFEVKSDIDSTRYDLYKQGLYNFNDPNFKFDESHIEFIRENPKMFRKESQLFEQYEDEQIIHMMNLFSDNQSTMPGGMAEGSPELPTAQLGLGKWIDGVKDRQNTRRIDRTPIREANTSDLLQLLGNDYEPGDETRKGHYDPKEKEIVIWRNNIENDGDYDDTVKHEQVHASQWGVFNRIAEALDLQDNPRIRDREMRKAYRKLNQGDDIIDYSGFNAAGKYLLDDREEYEAVLTTGINAAREMGVDFSGSFDDVEAQLKKIESPTNNMTGLMKFMDQDQNTFTQNQKDIIFQSFQGIKPLQSQEKGGEIKKHTIVRGDTGKTLFEKYGVTASDIKDHNDIKFFKEGQEIEIPSRELPKAQKTNIKNK
jgi:hypothetical protein